jgi:hypothetical protein
MQIRRLASFHTRDVATTTVHIGNRRRSDSGFVGASR